MDMKAKLSNAPLISTDITRHNCFLRIALVKLFEVDVKNMTEWNRGDQASVFYVDYFKEILYIKKIKHSNWTQYKNHIIRTI